MLQCVWVEEEPTCSFPQWLGPFQVPDNQQHPENLKATFFLSLFLLSYINEPRCPQTSKLLVNEVKCVVLVTRVMRKRAGTVAAFGTETRAQTKKMVLKNTGRVNVNVLSWVAVVLSPEPNRPFSMKLLLLMICECVFP